MQEALIALVVLVAATIIGAFLSPTEAQIQAAAPADTAHHDDSHGHGHH
jgi:hypothetical protein